MKKRLLLLTILFATFTHYTKAQDSDFSETLEKYGNAEIVEALRMFADEISGLFSGFGSFFDEEEEYDGSERITDSFAPDTLSILNQLHELSRAKLSLLQDLEGDVSSVQVEKHFLRFDEDSPMHSFTFTPKKIFFYDGTSTSEDTGELDLDFHFSREWPYKKRIDSVECEIKLKYITDFDILTLTAGKPKAIYNGKNIELIKIDKNRTELLYNKEIPVFLTEGLNANNDVLSYTYSSTTGGPEDPGEIERFKKELNTLIAEAEKDTLLPGNEFREKYKERFREVFDIDSKESDTKFKKTTYQGLVKGLRVYINKGQRSVTVNRMIKRDDFDNIHIRYTDSINYLLDNEGNIIYTMNNDISQINPSFYQDTKYYYYFDPINKELEPLTYYSVERLTSEFVETQEDAYDDYTILDNKKNKIGSFDDIFIFNDENIITARKGKDYLIIGPSGQQKQLRNIDKLGKFINGFAVIVINEKYGFIDQTGNIVIPAIYDDAAEFGDMTTHTSADLLFAVKKGEYWGFTDITNKTVIPFEYENAIPFSYGITMVKKDGYNMLIDTHNQQIAPLGTGSYMLSTNFGKRMYSLGNGNYDHLGRPEAP